MHLGGLFGTASRTGAHLQRRHRPASRAAWLAAALAAVVPCWAAESQEPATRPNIVFILADDLGYGDVGYHESEIRTPHLDALASGGARLEQFYVQPVCSPTRAALLTGRYPIRHGLQVGVIRPWHEYGLPVDERTLAQALREAGYFTAISGKWHLGLMRPDLLPTQRGFDHQYGHYCGAIDYYKHQRDGGHDWHRNDKAVYEEGYSTDLLADEAVRLIEGHDAARPLFLYVPFNAVHSPLQAPQSYIDQYAHIKDQKRRVYAAMTSAMDDAIGRIVAAVDRRGLRERTLIVFSSDNGGPLNLGATNGPYRAGKGSLYEGGVRVTALANWPGRIKPGTVVDEPLHAVDWYPTLLKLAGASPQQSRPLDGYDIWGVITAGQPSPHTEILHNVNDAEGAIRRGDWKLVVHRRPGKPQVELFNIRTDPYEKQNVADSHPEVVTQLEAALERYAGEALPSGNTGGPARGFKVPKVWGEADPQ